MRWRAAALVMMGGMDAARFRGVSVGCADCGAVVRRRVTGPHRRGARGGSWVLTLSEHMGNRDAVDVAISGAGPSAAGCFA